MSTPDDADDALKLTAKSDAMNFTDDDMIAENKRLLQELGFTRREANELRRERGALRAELLARNAAGEVPRIKIVAEALRAYAESKALRAALEEVCRCSRCGGSGRGSAPPGWPKLGCESCNGTGRDYHGSDAAKRLLEEKP